MKRRPSGTNNPLARNIFHEETFTRGDAYYLPPGHAPRSLEETEVFEVSPAADLHHVIEVITTCRIDEHCKESS